MGLSSYLYELNKDSIKEGTYTFGLLSTKDDLIGYGDLVWGQFTSEWPTMDKSIISDILCHMDLRD